MRALSPYVGTASENARDIATLHMRVHQIVTRRPVTLHPESEIPDAIRLFLEHRVSCIPIVDKDFKPVGIVSWRDVLKTLV